MIRRILSHITLLVIALALQSICSKALAQKANPVNDSTIYFQQFETQHSGPTINHGDTAISKVENGNFVMDVKRANRFWTLHFDSIGDPHRPEIVEIKLKMEADSLPGVYGLSWNARITPRNTWEDFVFLLSTDKQFCIFYSKSGQGVPISGWQPCFYVNSTGYNMLRVEKNADNLYQFYVNNELVYQRKLPPMILMFGGLYTDPHSILYVDFVKLGIYKKSKSL